ncbi:hypothetical protein [Barnesiella intestinihominis]|uniref:hypothetical protein n=1 Tax=Barnesiella intestinihominis TaxID=487174 RepID=UPI001896F107|nr:hypothetical protein [Barnesiella intestinihominis]MDB0679390.1 hypothetical protein [Barnesiella intestinihominis]MDB0685042.1 hypothetical protein [Barnesiella intestinihominis]
MERKVGEIFEYNGEWYQCVEQPKQYDCATVCELCSFNVIGNCDLDKGSGTYRSDKKSVIFKKLEKVGEPTMLDGKLVQKILTTDRYSCNGCCFESPGCDKADNDLCCEHEIYVEIKQNKEDMEEEKLNLKKFDLEAAKAGKPVCTRDGRKARIISFDRHGEDCPIIALVVDSKNAECEEVIDYTLDGICNENIINHNKYDLMMFTRKKEGWLNIFKDFEDTVCCVYPTEKEALEDGEIEKDYITTIKIEWEE